MGAGTGWTGRKTYWLEEREEMGELKKRQHWDGGDAAISLTSDVDGTRSGS